MDLNLSLPHVVVMVLGSAVGYVYFSWGRSQSDMSLVVCGLALMTYSYFFTSLIPLIAIGAALGSAPFAYRRLA